MSHTISPAGRAFSRGAIALALFVGALQMFHVRGGLLTNYGADVFGTAWLYAMFRQGTTIFQRGRMLGPAAAGAVVLLGCVGSEFGQQMHLIPGVFDRRDLLAYGATVLICYGIDRGIVALA